jgi:uncharacterized membrane-anchored protein
MLLLPSQRFARRLFVLHAAIVVSLCCVSAPATAQDATRSGANAITWRKGPFTADLNGLAEVKIPRGFAFADGAGTKKFLELNHNPTSGDEVGLIVPVPKPGVRGPDWFVTFEFDEAGYVNDADKSSLDADALLSSIRKSTESANEIRRQKGWKPFHVTGWAKPPFYEETTHNLTWAITGQEDGEKSQTINYSVRILGRKGIMSVDLVLDPDDLQVVLPQFSTLIEGFSYTSGNRYAEFMRGDKVAGYGLTALIAGGLGAAAVKTGLLAKLWKLIAAVFVALWKVIVFAIAALFAFIRRIFEKLRRVFHGEDRQTPAMQFEAEQAKLTASASRDRDDFQ